MKIVITIVLIIFLYNSSRSQNYECVKPLSVQHFLSDSAYPVLSVRIDSTEQIGDTTFYFNHYMFRPLGQNYDIWTVKGDPWTGKKILQIAAGNWVFVNGNSDSIFINSNAALNDTWRFCTLSDGNYYEAQLTVHDTITFFGITDSVKTFSIQKYNPSGQPISSTNNGIMISLSKNYGMIKTMNFDAFEYNNGIYLNDETAYIFSLHSYSLIGMTNPDTGWQDITAYDIYGLNQPGDEIHFRTWFDETYSYNDNASQNIYRFLNRYEYNNGDSVVYQIERCCLYSDMGPGAGMVNYTFVNDTVNYSYDLSSSWLNNLTLEARCDPNNFTETGYKFYNHVMNMPDGFYGPCEQTELIMTDGATNFTYKPFLWNFTSSGYGYSSTGGSEILYYKISGNEWGTPYSCDAFRLVGINNNAAVTGIKVYPNPFADRLFIELNSASGEELNIYICNVLGTVNKYKRLVKGINEIDLNGFSSGIYFYNIVSGECVLEQGKIIKI